MTAITEVVEGWTSPMEFTLKLATSSSTSYSPMDLTGLTVAIVLKDGRGRTVNSSTTGVSVVSSTGGTVQYAPTSSDFVAARSPYRVRFKLTDSTGRIAYHPNTDESLITVNTP